MSSIGPIRCSVGSTSAIPGAINWNTPTYIASGTGSQAASVFYDSYYGPIGNSWILRASSFGFAIPIGATINGIQMDIDCSKSNQNSFNSYFTTVQLIDSSSQLAGNNKAAGTTTPSTTRATATYGGSSDMWGTTFTPTTINSTNFGLGIIAFGDGGGLLGDTGQLFVYSVKATITYTGGAAAQRTTQTRERRFMSTKQPQRYRTRDGNYKVGA